MVLFQPYEFLIIGGAAFGSLFIANPMPVVIGVFKGILGIFKGSPYSKAFYLEQLKMLFDVFNYARKNGLVKLEADVEDPDKSQLFTKYPKFIKNHHAVHFVCDTLRMSISGAANSGPTKLCAFFSA